jgi:aminoglycoside 3-N-acetyltransferase
MGLALRKLSHKLKSFVPQNLKNAVRRVLIGKPVKKVGTEKVQVSLAELEKGLRELGIKQGDVLFVHSSADKLTSIEGGPLKILNLLMSIIGPCGTLAMPTFPFDGMASDYLNKTKLFDVRRTPSKVGLLSELFRRTPGVLRSIHPTHPVCAKGQYAEYFTSEHHNDCRPFGPLSPFKKMEEKHAKIVMIGVDSTYLTHSHVVEDDLGKEFPYNVYLDELKEIEIIDNDAQKGVMKTLVHNPEVTKFKKITIFEKEWIKLGVLQKNNSVHIELRVFDSVKLNDIMVKWALKKKTIYG